MLFKYFFT